MAVRRYAVLDADGVKINVITADEKLIGTGWYPGYGAALVDEGEEQPDPPPAPPPVKPDTWAVLEVKLAEPLLVGDRIDFKTMEVVNRVDVIEVAIDIEPTPEPIAIGPMKL